jgi:hypothetical protein
MKKLKHRSASIVVVLALAGGAQKELDDSGN